jgi:hypothetical protein
VNKIVIDHVISGILQILFYVGYKNWNKKASLTGFSFLVVIFYEMYLEVVNDFFCVVTYSSLTANEYFLMVNGFGSYCGNVYGFENVAAIVIDCDYVFDYEYDFGSVIYNFAVLLSSYRICDYFE